VARLRYGAFGGNAGGGKARRAAALQRFLADCLVELLQNLPLR
jgi:hypothetical protein